jgi:hypothetical protein
MKDMDHLAYLSYVHQPIGAVGTWSNNLGHLAKVAAHRSSVGMTTTLLRNSQRVAKSILRVFGKAYEGFV